MHSAFSFYSSPSAITGKTASNEMPAYYVNRDSVCSKLYYKSEVKKIEANDKKNKNKTPRDTVAVMRYCIQRQWP